MILIKSANCGDLKLIRKIHIVNRGDRGGASILEVSPTITHSKKKLRMRRDLNVRNTVIDPYVDEFLSFIHISITYNVLFINIF